MAVYFHHFSRALRKCEGRIAVRSIKLTKNAATPSDMDLTE